MGKRRARRCARCARIHTLPPLMPLLLAAFILPSSSVDDMMTKNGTTNWDLMIHLMLPSSMTAVGLRSLMHLVAPLVSMSHMMMIDTTFFLSVETGPKLKLVDICVIIYLLCSAKYISFLQSSLVFHNQKVAPLFLIILLSFSFKIKLFFLIAFGSSHQIHPSREG